MTTPLPAPTPWAWMLPDRSTHLHLPAPPPMFQLTARRWGRGLIPRATTRLVDETTHIPALPEHILRTVRRDDQMIFGEMGYGKATLGKHIPQWWIDRVVIEQATAPLFAPPRQVAGESRRDARSDYEVMRDAVFGRWARLGRATGWVDPFAVAGVA